MQFARQLARSAGLLALSALAGSAAAIDTLAHPSEPPTQVAQAEPAPHPQWQTASKPAVAPSGPKPAAQPPAINTASDGAGAFQPLALALAGALLMAYIGLRRPPE
jgi:hypothetical protein